MATPQTIQEVHAWKILHTLLKAHPLRDGSGGFTALSVAEVIAAATVFKAHDEKVVELVLDGYDSILEILSETDGEAK